MEDMARLALVEQNVRDTEKFVKLIYKLLRVIQKIIVNPHDYELRTITSTTVKKHLTNVAFVDYLKYIGFEMVDNDFVYPKDKALSGLRMAQAALERKFGFCTDKNSQNSPQSSHTILQPTKPKLVPENILYTKNPFFLKIQALFNNMLRYEDESLQAAARAVVPLASLQLAALGRLREQQRMIKAGETEGPELPFDVVLLSELMLWFKQDFFKWVDKPACERCRGATKFVGSTTTHTPAESYTVELYNCTECATGRSEFPRYNDPRTLLRTRRGRCGEWANCFTLLCRALGYDTRYVYDTTDHVWCEVYDYDTKTWLHVDPCEAKLDAPLLYSAGWGKKLSYVIAFSRDDLQDVTWRYTTDHRQVLSRRELCSEQDLVQCILLLREHRQRQVSEARRKYLARRALEELAQLMVERKAGSYEFSGRVSGALSWRRARGEGGEGGAGAAGHEFRFGSADAACVRYYCAADEYRVTVQPAQAQETIRTWAAGAYAAKDMFRKVEDEWQKVYLARKEDTNVGFVVWRLSADTGRVFTSLSVTASYYVFSTGRVRWTVRFDSGEAMPVELEASSMEYTRRFRTVELTAEVSSGSGPQAWQHAQLFRQPLAAAPPALELRATLAADHH